MSRRARIRDAGIRRAVAGGCFCRFWGVAATFAALTLPCPSVRAEGIIQTILDSVRGDSGDESGQENPQPARRLHLDEGTSAPSNGYDDSSSDPLSALFAPVVYAGLFVAASPFWGPCAVLDDDYSLPACFPRFPYDNVAGHLADGSATGRIWSGRFNVEYLEPFTDANGVGGRVLLSTTSRFGLDAEASHFNEHRANAEFDTLWVGDCNLVFRFAQAEKAEFRAGLGFNWLDSPGVTRRQSDFGFNFTYGADFFPRKPWIFSADLDAGNLGRAALVRFRTTGGILLHGVEAYTGYEYLDIGRGHFNLLVAGVRAWF